MRWIFGLMLGCAAILPASAQTTSSTAWRVIEQLPQGSAIKVHASAGSLSCAFVAADEDSLTCQKRSHWFTPTRSATFSRADVLWIKGSRREVSTFTGSLIGLGAGAAIGVGVDASSKSNEDGHLATVALALLGLPVGLAVGNHTDFLAGPVLYRAR